MFKLNPSKKADPFWVKVIVVGLCVGIAAALIGSLFGNRMGDSPENRAMTEIITHQIAPTESWTVDRIRLIPERSERGRYLTGEYAGQKNGRFVYEITLKDQPYPLILEVAWRWDTDLGIEELVVVNYRVKS